MIISKNIRIPSMIFKYFQNGYRPLIFVILVCISPFSANSINEEEIEEKRIKLAMRMIGHEVLMSLGDEKSRVLPIKRAGNQYKIPFEAEFGFSPDNIIPIVEHIMTENQVALNYLVEVENCETGEVVHSFEIRTPKNGSIHACGGRALPKACYSLWVTLLDDILPTKQFFATNDVVLNNTPTILSGDGFVQKIFPSELVLMVVVLLFGLIVTRYFLKKQPPNPVAIDPNLHSIGAYQFDTKNKTLAFENQTVELSHKEAALLDLLQTSANTPIEREVLLQKVWGDEGNYVGRTLDVFISKLRKKLDADTNVKIVNIRGVGYKLVMDVAR